MSPLRQRCLSTLLAATYLVVGATGDALFYLVESPTLTASAEERPAGSYFHDHGDGHWHHHGFHRDDRATAAAPANRGRVRAERAGGVSTACFDAESRHDHSTALLAIASAIELSLLDGSAAADFFAADCLIGLEDLGVATPRGCVGLGPRGPPCGDAV